MNGSADAMMITNGNAMWNIWLAREADQDLEFEEGLEDDELGQHKPPSRRPLIWAFVLLVALGVIYWALKPDFSSFAPPTPSMDQPPAEVTIGTPATILPPKFSEGQKVLLRERHNGEGLVQTLKGNPSGTQRGPAVTPGDRLTVLDGQISNGGWIYEVQTPSGEKGWISEQDLRG